MRVEETCKCSAKIVIDHHYSPQVFQLIDDFRELHSGCLVVDMEPTTRLPVLPPPNWWSSGVVNPTIIRGDSITAGRPWNSKRVDLDKLDDEPDPVLDSINQAFH